MKLYYAPGACSLADHIALHEAGLAFEHERVDLKTKRTEHGEDFAAVNPKGYVPALTLDTGVTLTENVAILDWIARRASRLMPQGGDAPGTQLLEMLAFISSEIHKGFKPFHKGGSDEEKAAAAQTLGQRFTYIDHAMKGDFIFGPKMSAADAYLFVMLLWAERFGVATPERLAAFRDRMKERPAVRTAMTHEGLI